MTSRIKTEAFVLDSRKWSDNSLILHFLTPEYGLVKSIAKGALRTKSKFRGKYEVLNRVEILYHHKESRDLQLLTDMEVVAHYPGLRKRPEGLPVLFIMVEIIRLLIHENERTEIFFRHLTRLLDTAEENEEKVLPIFFNFVAAVLSFSGYGLSYRVCSKCGSDYIGGKGKFELETGRYICGKCSTAGRSLIVSGETVKLLRELTPYKNMCKSNAKVSYQALESLLYLTDSYLSFHLGRKIELKGGKVLKDILA